nr:uncharacterized mitochondrial protein AtMg00810-like [Tanacetum cinerariifolium]
MDINIDALYNILKQNQGDVNDAIGSKKKTVVVTFDPLDLIAKKTKVSKSKEKVVVSSDSEGSEADDFNKLKKITAFDSDQEINANMVFMAQIEKVLSDSEASSSSTDEKIYEQTSSLKPYVPNVILEKIIIDLEDEVVNLLEKEKVNLETIESLKSKVPTPMVEQAKLKLDLVGKPVDHTDYRNMIGSLMYVTSSRPDIMFATCMCARYQANPNEHHVSAVKRIFRYLKGTINLGLWYPKDSGFDLTAYSDTYHTGCNLDRKSTSGSVQYLGDKLSCWSSKKQNCVSISIAESEYVTVSSCCAQVLWMRT